ncbi:DUF1127 domain-containing protein [Qingshengfaniella alkalisoli]|uniref:DUF1127 domain-containing protein n=2 Tax=Qingshengfaniella alkalisoli TaxID=2599296 RepID=A0A5B8IZ97_9RHOB|nr:DUF1127 domain-containing protein [Qingshengfaniella alkalisoli]
MRVGMPRLKHLLSLQRQRRDLGSLEDHLLRDIGVSQHEADIEASRRIWDVPSNWKI